MVKLNKMRFLEVCQGSFHVVIGQYYSTDPLQVQIMIDISYMSGCIKSIGLQVC